MKANELMIDDWVYCPELDENIRITVINSEHNEVKTTKGHLPTRWTVNPIPLTEEILKANGFYFGVLPDEEDVILSGIGFPISCDKRWLFDNENGGVVTVQFPKDCDGGEVYVSNIDNYVSYVWENNIYVHQFQHLLRACGLYDMADNFKIE